MLTPARHLLLIIWPYLLQAVCPFNECKHHNMTCFLVFVVKCIAEMSFMHASHVACGLIVSRCFSYVFSF